MQLRSGTPEEVGMSDFVPPYYAAAYCGLDTQELQETPWATGGVHSTAMDMAIFGQMFLNGGNYGQTRILSPTTVAAMTRNQIPGVGARWEDVFFPEAVWGLGWDVHGGKKDIEYGSMFSSRTFSISGAGGVNLSVDPVYGIVGAYFSVVLEYHASLHHKVWCNDLFMNAVSAAVVEM